MENDSRKWQRGFSLIEAIIVVALIAFLVAVASPLFYSMFQRYRIETATQRIEVNLRFARYAAVKRKLHYQVFFKDASYVPSSEINTYRVLYDKNKDDAYDEVNENVPNIDTTLPPDLSILTGSTDTVTFNARGAADVDGGADIRIQGKDGSRYKITVLPNGSVVKVKEA